MALMKGMHFSFIFTLPLCYYVDFNLLFFYNLQFLFRYASVTNSQGVAVYTVKGTLSHLEDDLKKSINLLKSSTHRWTLFWQNRMKNRKTGVITWVITDGYY